MAGRDASLTQVVVELIWRCSALRKLSRLQKAEICRDTLAVLAGVRPAALIDYAVVDPSSLLEVLSQLPQKLPSAFKGVTVAVAALGDCSLLLNLELLEDRLATENVHAVKWISFPKVDGQTICRWATADESAERSIIDHTIAFVNTSCLGLLSKEIQAEIEGLRPLLPPSVSGMHLQVVRLDAEELPILPTLQGWLLGYPIVYLVSERNIKSACRLLSTEGLLLFCLSADCQRLQEAVSAAAGGWTPPQDFCTVASFSMPAVFARDGRSLVDQWLEKLNERLRRRGQLWGEFTIETRRVTQTVVL